MWSAPTAELKSSGDEEWDRRSVTQDGSGAMGHIWVDCVYRSPMARNRALGDGGMAQRTLRERPSRSWRWILMPIVDECP